MDADLSAYLRQSAANSLVLAEFFTLIQQPEKLHKSAAKAVQSVAFGVQSVASNQKSAGKALQCVANGKLAAEKLKKRVSPARQGTENRISDTSKPLATPGTMLALTPASGLTKANKPVAPSLKAPFSQGP